MDVDLVNKLRGSGLSNKLIKVKNNVNGITNTIHQLKIIQGSAKVCCSYC